MKSNRLYVAASNMFHFCRSNILANAIANEMKDDGCQILDFC